ncbi:MAG: hypothetical protein LBU20_01550 [Candidatus Nomurabacteria bacterium]|jgi:hypothetical protein|nr:hypothetical protein [Candidatus Nomurabacteria bacterium]
MQFTSLIEALHKFTITYPTTLTVLFGAKIITAHAGQVVSSDFADQLALINGALAARAATYLLWNKTQPLAAIASA